MVPGLTQKLLHFTPWGWWWWWCIVGMVVVVVVVVVLAEAGAELQHRDLTVAGAQHRGHLLGGTTCLTLRV